MTLVLRINGTKQDDAIDKAVEELRKGKTVVYPTETSYGIGASIQSEKAVQRIKEIKSRRDGKPFLMLVADREMIEKYGVLDKDAEKLLEHFKHGRLSMIVEKKDTLPAWVSSSEGVGFRIARHDIARALCERLGEPIITTSANLYGYDPCYTGEHAIKVFDGIADVIMDAGELKERPNTTIFDVKGRKICRQGEVTLDEIMAVLEE
ncbi:threonylcarbamoyl-AMP synthase [Candidatus Micrarchaeota archaeon]|nr:threonylcarbamoyl-AMP synthase [Candidatus Micrarchaeota archaeon]